MEKFISYINSVLPDGKGSNDILFKFKRKTLDEMNEQYNTVMQRGISNTQVLSDLVISEHQDLKSNFEKYQRKELAVRRAKRNTVLNIVGSVTYILCIIVAFLGIGFSTHTWSPTWLIVVDGILLWVAYLLSLGVRKITGLKRIFHIFARILMALDVMVVSVEVFLFSLSFLKLERSWLFIILGVAAMFVADAVYAVATKQKLAILNILIYMPVVATMLYIILSAFGILAWRTGWLLIIVSLIINMLIIFVKLTKNKMDKMEVIDTWQEN